MNSPLRILFVCTGNICRSPLAEAVLADALRRRGASGAVEVDSAGTDAYHAGELSDGRMRRVARSHGVRIDHRARRVQPSDFREFDRIYAMDTGHRRTLERMAPSTEHRDRILMFRDSDPVTSDGDYPEVPDPWYGGMSGFERVFEIVSRTCERIADEIVADASGARRTGE
jgi:protein-tyrosine phosphatase